MFIIIGNIFFKLIKWVDRIYVWFFEKGVRLYIDFKVYNNGFFYKYYIILLRFLLNRIDVGKGFCK